MNIYSSVILIVILVIAFYLWIIPTSNIGISFLNKMEAEAKKDLIKWKKRQKRQNTLEMNGRLL